MSVEILGVKLERKQYAVADACAAWWWSSIAIVNDDAAVAKHLPQIPGVDLEAHFFYSFRIIVTCFPLLLVAKQLVLSPAVIFSPLTSQLVLCFLLLSRDGLSLLLASLLCWRAPAHPFPINDISHRTSRPPARNSLILFAPTTMLSGLYYNPLSHHVPSTEGVVEPGRQPLLSPDQRSLLVANAREYIFSLLTPLNAACQQHSFACSGASCESSFHQKPQLQCLPFISGGGRRASHPCDISNSGWQYSDKANGAEGFNIVDKQRRQSAGTRFA